ncbi:MAG TPA: hypothetical protein VNA89_05005 [Gemmatimonadaceae bacterium]|nr:hypothetical protein [Gemmatimonadaceae bacterium]
MTTVGRWLAERGDRPPAALEARLRVALAGDLDADASELPERCLAAGERLLGELLARGATDREGALDLLCADALVTYAFEAASADPGRLEERAETAMERIAAIGERGA